MTQLLAFYGVEWIVGLLLAATAVRLRSASAQRAWTWFGLTGLLITGWSTVHLYGILTGRMLSHVDTAVLLGVTALLSAAFIRFHAVYGRQEQLMDERILPAVAAAVIVIGGLFMAASASTVFLAVAVMLLIPGTYALVRLLQNSIHLWGPFTAATGVLWIYLVIALYRTTCSACTGTTLSLPLPPTVQEQIIASQPVRMLATALLLAYGCYLFLHGVVRTVAVQADEEKTAGDLVQAVVRNIGAIIGEPVAARMAADAVETVTESRPAVTDDTVSIETDDIALEKLADTLADRFAAIGPVGERKVRKTAEELGVTM